MAGFGVTAGVGVAAFTGFAVGTPLYACELDQCSGGSGVVSGALVGGPLIAIGLAGLAITGAWRHRQRSAWHDADVAFTGTGIAGRF